MVGQNPAASFVTDVVEDELAYTMENLGLAPDVMRRRVEDTLDLLGLHELRYRPLGTLSGGQQQRVAIGAVLTASPRVLVLDEPTSALDPAAAEEVLASLTRLVHDLGLTVLLAEHRLERVLPFADSVVLVPGAGLPLVVGPAAEVMVDVPGGAAAGRARPAGRLGAPAPVGPRRPTPGRARCGDRLAGARAAPTPPPPAHGSTVGPPRPGRPSATATVTALDAVDLEVRRRRDRGRHGPQRVGQVHAAVAAGRRAAADRRAGRRGR